MWVTKQHKFTCIHVGLGAFTFLNCWAYKKKNNNSNKLSFESKSFVVVVDMTASASYAEIITEFASLGLRDLYVGKKLR